MFRQIRNWRKTLSAFAAFRMPTSQRNQIPKWRVSGWPVLPPFVVVIEALVFSFPSLSYPPT